jgi:hypothetical protein
VQAPILITYLEDLIFSPRILLEGTDAEQRAELLLKLRTAVEQPNATVESLGRDVIAALSTVADAKDEIEQLAQPIAQRRVRLVIRPVSVTDLRTTVVRLLEVVARP